MDPLKEFNSHRERMNEEILGDTNLEIMELFNLNTNHAEQVNIEKS